VLNPFQIHLTQTGLTMILVAGITCLVFGFWIIPRDLQEIQRFFAQDDGWIFTIPIALVISDIYLTLIGLSRGNWELNPYVSSAVLIGPWAVLPFIVSYAVLSEGLALWMLSIGRWLFGRAETSRFIPFALVSGAASFGPISNLGLLAFPTITSLSFSFGIIGMSMLALGIYQHFRRRSLIETQLFLGSTR
jgi:hypothetical protein